MIAARQAVPDHRQASGKCRPLSSIPVSVAAPVDKATLLEAFDSEIELVEAEAQVPSAAMAVTEEEDVMGWAEAIVRWMEQRGNPEAISLVQLQQELGMPLVEVWMGLLLSQEQQYEWEQREEFYNLQRIWLRQRCIQD